MRLFTSLDSLMDSHINPKAFSQHQLGEMLEIVVSFPVTTIQFVATRVATLRPELAPFKAKVLEVVEPIVSAQGKPAVVSESVAASELVATAATNPDSSITDLAQHSKSASPCVSDLPPGQAESGKKHKKKKKKKKQDAALTAQHTGDQDAAQIALQQDNDAAAGAAEEPALAPVGTQPAEVLSQHFLPFL